MKQTSYDVVIIGGGIMGCATAYSLLAADRDLQVAVVERDPTYSRASTSLSLANVRVQFSLPQNILISLHALQVLQRFAEEMVVDGEAPDVAFRRQGNLFLIGEGEQKAALSRLQRQQELGGEVQWWSPEEVVHHYPLYHPLRFAGATFGAGDGYLDAHAFLAGYRRKALSLGAVFVEDEVTGVVVGDRRATGVRLASGSAISAGWVVSCTGAWAAQVARTAGVSLPIAPVKRQVFVLRPAVQPDRPLPLTNLPSGLYFRTETGGLLLAGRSLPDDPVSSDPIGSDLSWDEQRFIDHLWPELADLVPAFECLRIERGWAGLYAVNTFDGNALLGEWPEVRGLLLANGFSGHGLQQAPAVGRYLAELIIGSPPALDLTAFSPQRLLDGRPLQEDGLI